jgi:hypothetical protein
MCSSMSLRMQTFIAYTARSLVLQCAYHVGKIAEKIMSKNKPFLVLELGVAQLLFSQTCSIKFLHVLTKTNRR